MEIRSILAPTDFSWGSNAATRTAATLADKLGARLHLLHVIECPPVFAYAPIGDGPTHEWSHHEASLELAKSQLESVRKGLPTQVETETQALVGLGSTGADIVRVADSIEADLLVMATHGRTGFAHALIGSIAERVVRTASCPVLTLKAPEQRDAPPIERAQVSRILYATDLSEASKEALQCSVALRETFDAELDALFVMENIEQYPSIPWEYLPIPGTASDMPRHQAVQAEKRLHEHVAGSEPLRTVLRRGTSYQEIVDQAHESHADLIVLSTHGHTGLRHTLLGSVAEKVVRLSHCPVLTMRHRKEAE